MASPQFINFVKKELNMYKEIYGYNDDRFAFEPWALQYILGIDRDMAVNNTDTLSRGDEGLDGWYYDYENNIFHVFQMKYPDDTESVYNGSASDELVSFLNKLLNKGYTFKNKKLQTIYDSFYEVHNPDIRVRLNIVVFSKVHTTYKTTYQEKLIATNTNVESEVYDIDKLFNMYIDENDMADLRGEKIDLDILNGQYIEVDSKDPSSIGNAAIVTLYAKSFATTVKKYYPHIVAKNVRFHLGKSKNQGMIDLLQNEQENYKFWYYNNGITILCDKWSVDESSQKISLTNPQIINGGQTSKTLAENIDFINDKINILAKIIELGTDEEKAKVEGLKIAETSNTQNKVTESDLKSLCPIQKAIKANFESLEPKWYYEIKNKEWDVLNSADKRIYGKNKLNKTDIGQEWRMVKDNPIDAISKKEEMYTNRKIYTKVFSADRDVYEYLYAHKIVNLFTNLVSDNEFEKINEYDKQINKELLTRILSAKKMSIGYMSYLLNIALEHEHLSLNYQELCNKLDHNISYFQKALKIIFMSFRAIVKDIDSNESLLNNLRRPEVLQKCIEEFDDKYELMTQFGNTKIFN